MIKNQRIIKRVLKVLLLAVFAGVMYSFINATVENIKVNKMILDFKRRATQTVEVDYNYTSNIIQKRVYHIIPREYDYELSDTRSVYYNDTQKYLGQAGDIFLAPDSPFPQVPVFHQFMTYYFGGHATFKNDENRFFESMGYVSEGESIVDVILQPGNEPNDYSVKVATSSNYWLYPEFNVVDTPEYEYYGPMYRNRFWGMRVKNVTTEQIDTAIDYANHLVGHALYNYLFFLDTKYKYYCDDLVSRSYQAALLPENEQRDYAQVLNDGFITSLNDITLSKETYLIFYVEVIDDVVHIYQLADV